MVVPEKNKYNYICFLDVDGVLNSELFYTERYSHITRYDGIPFYRTVRKHFRKLVKKKEISGLDFYKGEMCPNRMAMLNSLCAELNIGVVLSASMRSGHTVEELQEIFKYCGATFTIIDKTGSNSSRIRGVEIHEWLVENTEKWFDVKYYDFNRFIIIDDDSDMLLWQQYNFFQTDNYCGLTPTLIYKARRFLTNKTFE